MKKLFCFVLVLCLSFAPIALMCNGQTAYAKEVEENSNSVAYEYMKDFVTKHPDRTAGTKECLDSANYIKEKFIELGLSSYKKNDYLQSFKYFNKYNNNKTENGFNVIGIKKASKNGEVIESKKQVVIGANYDNVKKLLSNKDSGNGAMYNATGIGVMLAIASNLKEVDLPYNVVFVAFGAKEIEINGSRYFVSALDQEQKNNTLLMVNFNGIGAGDKTYIYDDEIRWLHYGYIKNIAKELNITLNDLPFDKKNIMVADNNIKTKYTHQALSGDNAPFIGARIPSINFFSANYNVKDEIGFRQSGKIPNTYGTVNDNLKKFDEYFGKNGTQQMDNVVNIVTKTLKEDTFVSAMQNSINNAPDYSFFTNQVYPVIIVSVTVALIIIGLIAYYIILLKKANNSNDPMKPMADFEKMFRDANINNNTNENNGDPFGIDDNYKNHNNNNDDPFGNF